MNLNGFVSFYGTEDLDKTHKFYSGFLGLELKIDQGVCRIYKLPGGNLIGFCEHIPVVTKGNILTFLSDDVDGVYEKFVAAEIKVTNKPKLNEKYNIYHFFTNDPDGHTLEIQKFL